MAQIVAALEARVLVVGHASAATAKPATVEREREKLEISLSRANSVSDSLIGLGVATAALTVRGAADNEPAYGEETLEGEAGNRRAEIFIQQ